MWHPEMWPIVYTIAITTRANANEITPSSAIVNW
jgi:hypothetical protein